MGRKTGVMILAFIGFMLCMGLALAIPDFIELNTMSMNFIQASVFSTALLILVLGVGKSGKG